MPTVATIAERYGLVVVEDACQATAASIDGSPVGSWGIAAAFSLHPLKNLNVWGDGGVVITRSQELAERLRLHRNHGLVNRDEIEFFGINCRLDTIQAVIANRLIKEIDFITNTKIKNAATYDAAWKDIPDAGLREVPAVGVPCDDLSGASRFPKVVSCPAPAVEMFVRMPIKCGVLNRFEIAPV